MKTYKRIEIMGFRRRVLIVAGEPVPEAGHIDSRSYDPHLADTVETESEEGQEILAETARLLNERISSKTRPVTDNGLPGIPGKNERRR